MKTIEGNIVDLIQRKIVKGRITYSNTIHRIEQLENITSDVYILPGLIDAHVHIESSMLTPLEYSKVALKHGVIAAVTDPHEIANVCGKKGVHYMVENAKLSPMKIFFGAPSCVPATPFETAGAELTAADIEELFKENVCSHLSEMMNFPGVIFGDKMVRSKLEVAKKYGKVIDGHSPLLTGHDLRKYVNAGIQTDHECTSLHEALEKISLGMKIMLRNSSASRDFKKLISLINTHSEECMLCTDDCHPDELERGYINELVKEALKNGYDLFDVLQTATKTANDFYDLNIGLLQIGDPADFIVVDNLDSFKILSTTIDGKQVYDHELGSLITKKDDTTINYFFMNSISVNDILIERKTSKLNVIQVVEDSLLTKKHKVQVQTKSPYIASDIKNDILKIVVVNRYKKAQPSVGFIKGFHLKQGAIAGSIAHDSHNIVAVGVGDSDILSVIKKVQNNKGGLAVSDGEKEYLLRLPVAGLMSDKSCDEVAAEYKSLSKVAQELGCTLHAPFMTLAFMSLLVIPELKLSDKGLFDVNLFEFIELQN